MSDQETNRKQHDVVQSIFEIVTTSDDRLKGLYSAGGLPMVLVYVGVVVLLISLVPMFLPSFDSSLAGRSLYIGLAILVAAAVAGCFEYNANRVSESKKQDFLFTMANRIMDLYMEKKKAPNLEFRQTEIAELGAALRNFFEAKG